MHHKTYLREFLIEPKKHTGAPIPLFDKLINEDASQEEVPVKRFYSKEGLIRSVQREIEHILGTRAPLKKEELTELEHEVLNIGFPPLFGLSDFSHYDGARYADHPRIARLCEEAITRYEPRLKQVRVNITGFDKQKNILHGNIRGRIVSDVFQEEITFPLILKSKI